MIIEQNPQGYRYSMEPFLLADFIRLQPGFEALDVGTGCGIIPLLLMARESGLKITAVEIQESLCQLARENLSRNGHSDLVKVIHGDFLREAERLEQGIFDLAISNPPYRKINTGRANPNEEKAIARHEILLDLNSLLEKTASLLKPGGQIALAYPPLRLPEVLSSMKKQKLFPARLRFIHGYEGADAKIFLIAGAKDCPQDCVVESPLTVYKKDNSYTEEMENIYASFGHTDGSNDIKKIRYGGGPG